MAAAQQILFFPKPEERDVFTPVVLAEAPEEVVAMPEGSLDEKIQKAKAVLKWAMQRFEICYSYSGGKDSSTVLSLALSAAADLAAEGREVKRFLVLNSDTLVENPEVLGVVDSEMTLIRKWITDHGLPGHVEVTTPSLMGQFAVSIIGGKSMISTPTTNRNCTTDMKSVPLSRARTNFFGKNKVEKGKFAVGVTGVRFAESAERAGNMKKRAESPVQVVMTDAKESVFLAPIAHWSTDDVMEYLGLAVNDMLPIEVYSDFKEVWRIYKDAEGECTVGRGDRPSAGCGARHGCYVCTMVQADKSMDAMLLREEYAYLQPLADFREFLVNTVHDLSHRTWVGRSIVDGHIVFGPDSYNSAYLQNLLRYALTIDIEEQSKAIALGIRPRFQLVSLEALIAIDAMWSLQAFALPFSALKIYRDIYVDGMRFPVPKVPKSPRVPVPANRYIPVKDWDEGAVDAYGGMRDPLLEMAEGPCSATRTLRSKATGEVQTVMDINVADMFSVDLESVHMLLEFELDRLVDKYHAANARLTSYGAAMAGQGYRFYLQYGTISLCKSQVGTADAILRRSAWRERQGLSGYNYDHARALAQSVASLPKKVEQEMAIPPLAA